MRKLDIQSLLMPENYDELEITEQTILYKSSLGKRNGFSKDWNTKIGIYNQPKPVKRFTKEEIAALEVLMKKEGKL